MLVKGQSSGGAISPSYACMMEFVVAAQGITNETLCTALQGSNLGDTLPYKYNKINKLTSAFLSGLMTLLSDQKCPKVVGLCCRQAISQTTEAATNLQATCAPDGCRIRKFMPAAWPIALSVGNIMPKPEKLQVLSWQCPSAKGINKVAGRRLLWLVT